LDAVAEKVSKAYDLDPDKVKALANTLKDMADTNNELADTL
jgi:hypothetical protein